jgi:hypothetical protein
MIVKRWNILNSICDDKINRKLFYVSFTETLFFCCKQGRMRQTTVQSL